MQKRFCLKCNAGTSYESAPPVFCSKCGKPYIDSNASTPPQRISDLPTKIISPQPIHIEEDDDGEEFTGLEPVEIKEIKYQLEDLRPNRAKIQLDIGTKEAKLPKDKPSKKSGKPTKINKTNEKLVQQQWAAQFPKNTRGNK